MPGIAKEIVLNQDCPLCYDEGKKNPLRNQAGVFGTYCVGSDGNSRNHFYDDTGTLRLLIKKMSEKQELAARRDAPATPPPPVDPQSAQPQTAAAEEEKLAIATADPRAFEVTEVDASRLSELLGQPIIDAGTLVGAIWTLKNDATTALSEDTRTKLAVQYPVGMPEIKQRADGLALQVFLPWTSKPITNAGWNLADKSNFNGVSPTRYAQDVFESIAAANYFPPGDLKTYPEVDPRSEGYWILVTVPEMYVGSMAEIANKMGLSVQQYLQNYFFWMIDQELFP